MEKEHCCNHTPRFPWSRVSVAIYVGSKKYTLARTYANATAHPETWLARDGVHLGICSRFLRPLISSFDDHMITFFLMRAYLNKWALCSGALHVQLVCNSGPGEHDRLHARNIRFEAAVWGMHYSTSWGSCKLLYETLLHVSLKLQAAVRGYTARLEAAAFFSVHSIAHHSSCIHVTSTYAQWMHLRTVLHKYNVYMYLNIYS